MHTGETEGKRAVSYELYSVVEACAKGTTRHLTAAAIAGKETEEDHRLG